MRKAINRWNRKGAVLAQSKSVLVVEDDRTTARLVQVVLTSVARVQVAYDGEQALHMVRNSSPDLVLSDIGLPGISGLELCHAIQADPPTSHIPVVLMSANREPNQQLCDAKAFIPKPFDVKELKAVVRELLGV